MRKKIGIACVVLGIACLLVALGFVVNNRREEKSGEQTAQTLLQTVQTNMRQAQPQAPTQLPQAAQTEQAAAQMQTVPAGEHSSIGILSIPVLELELPILTDWSYEKLKEAPCHYYGSCYGADFVIAAHNYDAHFGRLSQLQAEDLVLFTDVTGQTHCYEVVLLETLPPTATEEMITSGFDLSLYTCTPGGSNRVTVRCKAVPVK